MSSITKDVNLRTAWKLDLDARAVSFVRYKDRAWIWCLHDERLQPPSLKWGQFWAKIKLIKVMSKQKSQYHLGNV
eukprot:202371-Pelagomonas_calceolata.AAC.2